MPTSSILPVETQAENPTFRSTDQSRIPVTRAPDCDRKARPPGKAITGEKLAFRPLAGRRAPRQLGPTMRRFGNSLRTDLSSSSISRPAGPASRKPAEMTIMPRPPSSPNSRASPGTVGAGVQTTTRSGTTGSDASEGNVLTPATTGCLRFTANRRSRKGEFRRF